MTVCSNSDTIHLFYLEGENVKSKLKILGFISSYLGSEWSKLQYKIPIGEESFTIPVSGQKNKFYLFLRKGFVRQVQIVENKEFSMDDFENLLDFS